MKNSIKIKIGIVCLVFALFTFILGVIEALNDFSPTMVGLAFAASILSGVGLILDGTTNGFRENI